MIRIQIKCQSCEAILALTNPQTTRYACPQCGSLVVIDSPRGSIPPARANGNSVSRWREPQRRAPASAKLLASSYDAVNHLLDEPPKPTHDPQRVVAHDPKQPEYDGRQGVRAYSTSNSQRPPQRRVGLMLPTFAGALLALTMFQFARWEPASALDQNPQAAVLALRPVSVAKLSTKEIGERLAQPVRLPREVPLPRLARQVAQTTGVPIALDVDSLRYRQIGLADSIRFRNAPLAAGKALLRGLRPLQLDVSAESGMLHVGCKIEPGWHQASHDISDLINPDFQGDELIDLIRRFVRPESWDNADGKGQVRVNVDVLSVYQTECGHVDVLTFCDSLRAARGLPRRGGMHNWSPSETLRPSSLRMLQSPIDVDLADGRLSEIATRIEKCAACYVLVDWPAIYETGIQFDDRFEIRCKSKKMEEAVASCSDQLTTRVVAANAAEITTPAAEQAKLINVFHAIPRVADTEPTAMLKKTRENWPDARFDFAIEPVSGALVARMPWSNHRQLVESLP